MNPTSTIAVLGGGGRTGNFVVQTLLREGYSLKLLVRNPESLSIKNEQIEVIQGDALEPDAIKYLVKDCRAVVSTIGQRQGEPLVASLATRHILEAMKIANVNRYVLVAGLNVDVPTDRKGPATLMATQWMKEKFPTIQEDRQKTYALLVDSNVHWTLVRVPFIEFQEATGKITVSLEDCLGTKITAGDIAQFVADQLRDDKFHYQAPFVANL